MTFLRGLGVSQSRKIFLCLFWGIGAVLWTLASVHAEQQGSKTAGDSLESLHNIGSVVAKAVLAHDVERLLSYDRPELRSGDDVLLRNKKSDLYCYIFDSGCISGGMRSIYEILSSAQRLGISTQELQKSSDGTRYGLLLFYDRSLISQRELRSSDFLCKEWNKKIASWTFRVVGGKWVSAHPPFDLETDTLCSSSGP